MKKTRILIIALILSLALSVFCGSALAQGEQATVYVTLCNGSPVLAQASVTVTDLDGDGALTINDALTAAHELHFEGGAAAGYATVESEFGLGIARLWGIENGSGYGYYVNNASASNLYDTIVNGDYICAYIFTDTVNWSDCYSFFDLNTIDAQVGDTVTLTLYAAAYDEAWSPIVVPVEGAIITIDGELTDIATDAQGKAQLTLSDGKSCVISAVSDSMTLVSPVCTAYVSDVIAVEGEPELSTPASLWYIVAAVAVIVAVVTVAAVVRKRKALDK